MCPTRGTYQIAFHQSMVRYFRSLWLLASLIQTLPSPQPMKSKYIKILRSRSCKVISTRLSKTKEANLSLVRSSASVFSSRGRHLRRNASRAFDKEDESCMLTVINGHFVVARLTVRASLALLSVPPKTYSSSDFRSWSCTNHPNAPRATNVANSSAEVEAHWDDPSGLNRYGASLGSFIENHLLESDTQLWM